MSWHYTTNKIQTTIRQLQKSMVRGRAPLNDFRFFIGDEPGATAPAFDDSSWDTLALKGTYSAREQTAWLRKKVSIPSDWGGRKVFLALELNDDAEALVWVDGEPNQAIDFCHHELLLSDAAEAGRSYSLAVEAYTGLGNNWGVRQLDPLTITLKTAELQWIDRDTEGLYYDLNIALGGIKTMDVNSRLYNVILNALDETVNLIDFRLGSESDAFYDSVANARAYLKKNLYDKYEADPDFTPVLWSTGHAHIDTAWLWRIANTRKKVGRSFTTATRLMEQFPDYHFTCSQPQQYAYIKEDYPAVYERIKKAVKKGQWETVGGMWVESDCNVISGESLVRQFLYGLRFYQHEFGTHTNVVWLPDVFGYSAAFPQIIKKSGMKYFMTIKIYWSQINKPPYQTFEWEGIDGTTVLTHYSPLGDYNAQMTPEQWQRTWTEYRQKNLTDSALYIYGNGDGGGGPTRTMLENAQRAKNFPGLPKVKMSTADAFFADLERQVEGKRELPRWVGELYLEFHRGTYTSQGRNKRFNRQAEFLLQTAEQLASAASALSGDAYPRETLTDAWKLTLLNQFHDIIPGSSIHEVYEDSDKDYARIFGMAGEIVDGAMKRLAAGLDAKQGDIIVYNPLSWTRSDVAELPRSLGALGQDVTDLDGALKTLVELPAVPSLGYTVIPRTAPIDAPGLKVSTEKLENDFFTISLDASGEIASVVDKRTGREVIDQKSYCRGNALLTFEDRPMNWDAWDIDLFYQDKMTPVQGLTSIKVVETGPVRASVEIVREFGRGSRIRQRVSIYRTVDRIDFDTEIDWQERQTLLKAAFPVTIRSNHATYDIQFGNVTRPNHWNTSWDWAQFETCGHKWADLSEGDYGVAVLSDSKYGWDIRDNVIRLTLLKGGIAPDPEADLGRHRFSYSLFPHQADWRAGGVVQRGYEFNVPVKAVSVPGGGKLPSTSSLISVDKPNLILETVKLAEDDDALIVRLHETYGQRGTGALKFARAIKSAAEVNLLEVETDETRAESLSVQDDSLGFAYGPYEIKTFKVKLA